MEKGFTISYGVPSEKVNKTTILRAQSRNRDVRKSSTINTKAELALPNKDGIFRMGVTDYVIGESSGEKPPTRFWP
jgi:hypothetical protein